MLYGVSTCTPGGNRVVTACRRRVQITLYAPFATMGDPIQAIFSTFNMTDFENAIDCLIADCSPRSFALGLSSDECGMLLAAQRIRGTQLAPPDPSFMSQLQEIVFVATRSLRGDPADPER
jgi:hypothetical protein